MVLLNAAMKQMSYVPASTTVAAAKTPATSAPPQEEESFFQHILDVVNPLQHLPVIGTIYRAITGDKLDPVEKIAGDALYGGLWGAVSAVASVAFEAITGKSVEDTVLAWFDNKDDAKGDAPRAVAANAPAAQVMNMPGEADTAALNSALMSRGVNADLANRALYAYRRSVSLTDIAPAPVLASLH